MLFVTLQVGATVHAPSLNVRVIVGLAANPVPLAVSCKRNPASVPLIAAIDAVLPHPELRLKLAEVSALP